MPTHLRPREVKILEHFSVFPYMTAEQVIHLGIYGYGSRQAVREKLAYLTKEKYLLRDTTFKDTQAGSVPYVYWLAAIGRHYLAHEFGYDFDAWTRQPSEMRDFVKSSHFPHTLGINNFLIAALHITGLDPRIMIEKVMHDLLLKSLMQGAPVIPDGLIQFASGDKPVIWLEYDRKTEKEAALKEKIKRITAFIYADFADWFDTPFDDFTFAFSTPFGEHRVGEMLTWTQEQLTAMRHTEVGNKFLFACLPEKYDSSVFISPLWSVPFQQGKHRLVEL